MRAILQISCDSRSCALHLQGHGRGRPVSTDCQRREADFDEEKNAARDSRSAEYAVVAGLMVRPKRAEKGEISGRSKLVKAFWARLPVQKANRRTIMIRGLKPEAKIVERERRRTPRYPFIASAELIEEKADVRIASRVSELSLHGCYLDMMNPFPTGTMVLVKIAAGDAFFEAKSKIVYSQMNMGAGVSYLQIEPDSQAVLERWLDEAEKDSQKQAG